MITPQSSLVEVAFLVSTTLEANGIQAVLSGGGAATVYAPDSIQSYDLDFVLTFTSTFGASEVPILELGFQRKSGGYSHPASVVTLDFPPGPLTIGNELITESTLLTRDNQTLRILTPTDCVRDRLSWFLFYRNPDFSALEQALSVASNHAVNMDKIRTWALAEDGAERFKFFETRFKGKI